MSSKPSVKGDLEWAEKRLGQLAKCHWGSFEERDAKALIVELARLRRVEDAAKMVDEAFRDFGQDTTVHMERLHNALAVKSAEQTPRRLKVSDSVRELVTVAREHMADAHPEDVAEYELAVRAVEELLREQEECPMNHKALAADGENFCSSCGRSLTW